MADQVRTAERARGGRRRAAGGVLAALLCAAGCSAPADQAPDTTARGIRATLDRRAAAVLHHDAAGYAAVVAPDATALRSAQRREIARLADVPLGSWTYELTDLSAHGSDRATADVRLGYRIRGYDSAPVSVDRIMELARDPGDGRWYVTADRAADGGVRQLWEQGDIEVVRGAHSLVLGVGRSRDELDGIAATADEAVPAVSAAWPERWAGRVVVLVPDSVTEMGELLGSPAANYRGIAAVTTGETGGSGKAPADRVIVNPEAYAQLGDFGQRVVLTHETTHVATRKRTSAATPTWLSEGFADWAAYRDQERTAEEIAPELADAVRAGDGPAALPEDEDFAFAGEAGRLAKAYEGGWLACELIAGHWGEAKLFAFYRAVGAHQGRDGAVEEALHEVLGTTPQDFTARWRVYLRDRLG
ncbi:hypothetical protein [Streptomyces sp. ATexAB-D23]|uniref:hypothetical protein n=1 Tax=Streptomyces sp. ATexAB-D23 TaxID=1157635 RepID=UPI0003692471